MGTDDIITCPDPNCGARFKITRVGTRTFRYTLERESPRYKSIIHMNVNEEEQGGNDALAGK